MNQRRNKAARATTSSSIAAKGFCWCIFSQASAMHSVNS